MAIKKAAKSGRERRRFKRYPLKASVSFRIISFPSPGRMLKLVDAQRQGKVRDISSGGVCFHSNHLLLPGTILSLEVPKSPVGKAAKKRAKVVWVREMRPGDFRIGVKAI
jgi:hypothetical protein